MLSGKDVVIAAETGSGKTYSYLAPLIDKLAQEHSPHAVPDQDGFSPRKILLVLCPNVQLCEQVVRMADRLRGDTGETIVSVAAICGRQVVNGDALAFFFLFIFCILVYHYAIVVIYECLVVSIYKILALFLNFLCVILNTKNIFGSGMANSRT